MITRYVNTASTVGTQDGTTNTAGSSGTAAFATLRQALDSLPATLTDATTIYCEGSAADTGDVHQTPWDFVTSATNYLLICTTQANRHDGKWNTGKYRIEATNRSCLYCNVPAHVRIDGIQAQVTVTDGGNYIAFKGSNANQTAAGVDMRFSNCIAKGVQTNGDVTGFESRPVDGGTSGTHREWNNLAIDCNYGYGGDWASCSRYNCTAADCTYGFVADAAWTAINCLAHGATVGFVGSFGASSNYNAEDDGNGAPGVNSRSATTFTFVNAGADDFHLASNDAGARDYGSGATPKSYFTTDIDGQNRPATDGDWDIGADEYVVAEATGTGSLASQSASSAGVAILIAYPAYGYATPDAGEIAQSWSLWHLGAGAVVSGNADYGDLIIPPTVTCSSPVTDMGDADSKQITVISKYGTNLGTYATYIRGSQTLFAWNDGTPSWTLYTTPVTQAWRYVQVLLTGG